jgi:hypothetical protein
MKFRLLKPILASSLVIGALCAALSLTPRPAKAVVTGETYHCTCGCNMTWQVGTPDPIPHCCAAPVEEGLPPSGGD